MISTYVVYFIWALLPTFYALTILWGYLEKVAGSTPNMRFEDYWKQAKFTWFAFAVSVAIDRYLVKGSIQSWIEQYVPILLFQILLFPVVLYILSSLIGPTEEIRITKLAHVSKRPPVRK